MPKISFVNIPGHGHVNPTLALVRELVDRGVEVTCHLTEEWRGPVAVAGARFLPIDSIWSSTRPEMAASVADRSTSFPLRVMSEAAHVLPQLLPQLEAEKPDLLVYERLALAGRYASEKLRLRAAQVAPIYVINERFSLSAGVSPLHPSMSAFAETARAVALRYGVSELGMDLFNHSEDLHVVFVPRVFQYAAETFDERYVFVGPCLGPRPTDGKYVPPADGKPLLFVSLGTVFGWPELFKMCFEAFGGRDWHVLMAIGKRVDPATLGPAPANFEVAAYVPQLEVLPHARVFVTHGGMNSTMEALAYQVPMVVIPQMREQVATARRVTEFGLGHAMTREAVSAATLRDAVDALAHDVETKARVKAMGEHVRSLGGQTKAADAIMAHLAR